MSEDRRRRGKQAPARKKARASKAPKAAKRRAGKKRAVASIETIETIEVTAAVHEVEQELPPLAAVQELEPVEWARDSVDTSALFDAMGPDGQHPGYLTTGARRLVQRVARVALAPLSLARAMLGRIRDRS